MRVEVIVTQAHAVHAGECEVRSVIGSKADIIECIVIKPGQPLSALWVFPYPFAETVFDFLLHFAGGQRFGLIKGARAIGRVVIVYRWRAQVKRVFYETRGGRALRGVSRRVAN